MQIDSQIQKNTDSFLEAGTLYVVATPIGNLEDISQRALRLLDNVDWVAAEDTRHSKKLLQHFGLNPSMISLHDFNEQERSVQLLARLKTGETGGLISDAGTPLISDPGYHLVNLLRQNEIKVVPIPGPSAIITALSAAGLPTNRFSFEGFLPAKNVKRLVVLQALIHEPRTMVFYESPHRLLDSLKQFVEVFPDTTEMVIARELTKHFEQFVSGTVKTCADYFIVHPDKVRGEFVLMLRGFEENVTEDNLEADKLIEILSEQQLPVKQIAEIVSTMYPIKKKQAYQKAQILKENLEENK